MGEVRGQEIIRGTQGGIIGGGESGLGEAQGGEMMGDRAALEMDVISLRTAAIQVRTDAEALFDKTPEIAQEAIDIYDFSDCDNTDIRNELRDDLSDDECAAIRASFRKAWELADIEYKLELAENQLNAEKTPLQFALL